MYVVILKRTGHLMTKIERVHKLYRLVAYQRCSRWLFQILGKKNRRPFPACIYAKIRERFTSPDGLYTHFKYAKTSKRYCLCVSNILCINNTVQISLVMYQICFSIDDTYGSKFHAAHIDMVHTYLFIWKQINIKLTRFNFTCCRDKQASIFMKLHLGFGICIYVYYVQNVLFLFTIGTFCYFTFAMTTTHHLNCPTVTLSCGAFSFTCTRLVC